MLKYIFLLIIGKYLHVPSIINHNFAILEKPNYIHVITSLNIKINSENVSLWCMYI